MNGRRARVYSRIRENKLNPARDATSPAPSASRQVIQALLAKLDERRA